MQKNFLVGLKVCWSWGSGFFFKIPIGRTVFNFSCKTSILLFLLKRIPIFFDYEISETFIGFRGVLNLNGYMGKKVKKKFVMGLNIWWSWGSGFFFNFFFKIHIGRTVFNFSCKTSVSWVAGCSFRYLFCHFFVIFS